MLFWAWWQRQRQPGKPRASLLVEHWAKQTFAKNKNTSSKIRFTRLKSLSVLVWSSVVDQRKVDWSECDISSCPWTPAFQNYSICWEISFCLHVDSGCHEPFQPLGWIIGGILRGPREPKKKYNTILVSCEKFSHRSYDSSIVAFLIIPVLPILPWNLDFRPHWLSIISTGDRTKDLHIRVGKPPQFETNCN